MSHWTFWEWLGYVSIWIAAIISATEIGLKMATEFRSRTQHLIGNPYWAFAPIACLAISGMAFFIAESGVGMMTGLIISSALVVLWMALLICGAYKSQSKLGRLRVYCR
jgi:hypothetical protein